MMHKRRRFNSTLIRKIPGNIFPIGTLMRQVDRGPIRYLQRPRRREIVGNLLYWAVAFLVVAIIAALLGFGGVAGTAMEGAKILFWVALVLFVISLVFGFMRRGRV